LPRKGAVIQVDERARVIGRRVPTELGIVGSVRPTVKSLLDKAKPKSDSRFFESITAQRKKWDEMLDKQSDPTRSKDRIHPQAVARAVSDLAARDRIAKPCAQKVPGSLLLSPLHILHVETAEFNIRRRSAASHTAPIRAHHRLECRIS
jgi:hypothetical protein